MADQVTGSSANPDGSWTFSYTFDGGNGLTGNTIVVVPAPQPTITTNPDGTTTVTSPAVPWTADTAAAAAAPIAAAQKAAWLASLAAAGITSAATQAALGGSPPVSLWQLQSWLHTQASRIGSGKTMLDDANAVAAAAGPPVSIWWGALSSGINPQSSQLAAFAAQIGLTTPAQVQAALTAAAQIEFQ